MAEKIALPAMSVGKAGFEIFKQTAKAEGKTTSVAIREAMFEYLKNRNVEVDLSQFEVGSWGGDRRHKEE